MFSIRQNGTTWELLDHSGAVLSAHTSYDAALGQLAATLAEGDDTTVSSNGRLAERWTSTTGIAFQEQPDPERDFTDCTWSFRDPAVYPLPLMLQTSTDVGHFGAELAGFMDTVVDGDTPSGSGGFYDNDAGRQFRDLLAAGGRFGVSVDPGELEVEFACTEYDDDGWCMEGAYRFLAYQIIGLTGTPFPAFARATIEMDTGQAAAPAEDEAEREVVEEEEPAEDESMESMATRPTTVVASASTLSIPVRPPHAWFLEPEPELGDPRLVEQADGSLACPLYIGDDGQVYGNMARAGSCHVSNPQGPSVCVSPPVSECGYAGFMVGETWCEGGERLATGALVAGCDHPSTRLSAPDARDHYAHNGAAWADVVVTDGQWGPWVAGALRPEVSELQLRTLRGSALSGDWRELLEYPGRIELIAGLAVSVPGFGIARHQLVASGALAPSLDVTTRMHLNAGRLVALTASGIVSPCPDCLRRQQALVASGRPSDDDRLASMEQTLAVLERRTRHLVEPAAAHMAHRVRR